ncbi:MAG: hypothetical protein H6Q33_281 [Deltaproteobacteria bacterium]|jgi:energy-converting hydrogenase Eha subunit A|nr:hypothetical protein [Deltaproteobacteria bacterium]
MTAVKLPSARRKCFALRARFPTTSTALAGNRNAVGSLSVGPDTGVDAASVGVGAGVLGARATWADTDRTFTGPASMETVTASKTKTT